MKKPIYLDAKKLVESKIDSENVFSGKLLDVYFDNVTLPDNEHSTREWIKHPGACAVVPVFNDGSIMLVKQFRYPTTQIFYEVPAGKIDSGEPQEVTAERELLEESGLTASEMKYVGHFYPGIGYTDEIIHIYVAWNLQESSQNVDDDEFLINYRIPFREAVDMINKGDISDGKTVCSILKTKEWWLKNKPFEVRF
ncbi:MAG: NUDIX domain-containing protein [Balneolaceae bacterium]